MDSVTHTLFGVGIYKAVNKEEMSKKEKYALLFTSIAASQIPDIDIISQFWDSSGQYQMWHRGITHSLIMIPVWALLLFLLNFLIFRQKNMRHFYISLIAVFIHDTSDVLNAWGTGYLEPFISVRLATGTISIIDFVFWFIFLLAFVISKLRNSMKDYSIFRLAWVMVVLHVVIQSAQGYLLYQQYKPGYEQVALSARFIPWQFTVIAKDKQTVDIITDSIFTQGKLQNRIHSSEDASLDRLFAENPRAKTLYEWSPFVVIVDDDKKLGIYDPRFYRNGESFLYEFIEKTQE
ncbi:metal-dependent hydrolase [Peribacillus sp. SCS-155]|uniref:metal-dependent hydrolase n=1 Tax=Peribacillus sedimenti TaxID=3115297 RepID=UPI003905A3BB